MDVKKSNRMWFSYLNKDAKNSPFYTNFHWKIRPKSADNSSFFFESFNFLATKVLKLGSIKTNVKIFLEKRIEDCWHHSSRVLPSWLLILSQHFEAEDFEPTLSFKGLAGISKSWACRDRLTPPCMQNMVRHTKLSQPEIHTTDMCTLHSSY